MCTYASTCAVYFDSCKATHSTRGVCGVDLEFDPKCFHGSLIKGIEIGQSMRHT